MVRLDKTNYCTGTTTEKRAAKTREENLKQVEEIAGLTSTTTRVTWFTETFEEVPCIQRVLSASGSSPP